MIEDIKHEIIERIAAGLRRCENPPDYLIWMDNNEDYVWDEKHICNIPVLYVPGNVKYNTRSDADIPFIPCWKEEGTYDNYEFERGYEEWIKKNEIKKEAKA